MNAYLPAASSMLIQLMASDRMASPRIARVSVRTTFHADSPHTRSNPNTLNKKLLFNLFIVLLFKQATDPACLNLTN